MTLILSLSLVLRKIFLKSIAGGMADNLDVELAEQEGDENSRGANKKPAATPVSQHDVPKSFDALLLHI
ncbi:hypothetical protein RYX36_010532 [Vicia faba]